jgi:excisionase family DNA binding protein
MKLAFTYEEAGEAVGVSAQSLRRAVANHELVVRYIGTKPVIPADELKAWLDQRPTEAPGK